MAQSTIESPDYIQSKSNEEFYKIYLINELRSVVRLVDFRYEVLFLRFFDLGSFHL